MNQPRTSSLLLIHAVPHNDFYLLFFTYTHGFTWLGIATAIVVNGGYADDVDRGSVFIYVGEGGEQSGEVNYNSDNDALQEY